MKITDEDRAKAAALFADPLIHKILDWREGLAVDNAVAADATDDQARQAAVADIRAIRNLRNKLKNLAAEAK